MALLVKVDLIFEWLYVSRFRHVCRTLDNFTQERRSLKLLKVLDSNIILIFLITYELEYGLRSSKLSTLSFNLE